MKALFHSPSLMKRHGKPQRDAGTCCPNCGFDAHRNRRRRQPSSGSRKRRSP